MKKRIQYLTQLVSLEILVTAVFFLLSLFLFFYLVHEAVYERGDILDTRVIQFFSAHSSPALISAMKTITFFGSNVFLFPAYLVIIAWQFLKNRGLRGIRIAVIAISSTATIFLLKQLFHRQRPQLPIIRGITGYSFPSGHSVSSFIFCTILIYLAWKTRLARLPKYLLMFFLFCCPFAIGLSRIILNVHYTTDVIAGYCLAIVWVTASFAIIKGTSKNNPPGAGLPLV
ncbi:MAG: phosphatase PAP2 family protein [Bacteroidota bacterium]